MTVSDSCGQQSRNPIIISSKRAPFRANREGTKKMYFRPMCAHHAVILGIYFSLPDYLVVPYFLKVKGCFF